MPAIVTLTANPALDISTATDVVMPEHKLRCAEPRYDPGGGGINVARAVRLLGGAALAVFPAGGPCGEMLCRLLGDEGVAYDAVTIAGVTRESLAVVERQSGKQYRFLFPGPALGDNDRQRCLDVLAAHLAGAQFLVASGSLPPGAPAEFYAEVGGLARRRGVRFVLDTSGAGLTGAGADTYLLKTSLRELEELSGHSLPTEADEERAAREVVASGRARVLVVSLGGRGALLATNGDTRRFRAVEVEAIGSVGAGDSMVAGMILSLARGGTLIEAVKYGMAAGAAALLRPGTELCRREDTERLYRTLADK